MIEKKDSRNPEHLQKPFGFSLNLLGSSREESLGTIYKSIPLVILIFVLITSNAWASGVNHHLWNELLESHVENGLVNYSALKQNSINLDVYLKTISRVPKTDFETWSSHTQLACLINLYNAATVRLILDEYPLKSIKDIGFLPHAAWRKKFIQLWGKTISLNELEHELIRPRSKDLPAVHFALVCAAKGCPPLRSEAYTGELLVKQLENQGELFLTDTSKNRIFSSEKILYLSPVFEWYAEDFEQVTGSVKEYLTEKYPEIFPVDLDRFSIKYTHYDWSLNEMKVE